MAEHVGSLESYGIFEAIGIPFVLTDSSLTLIYANPVAKELLPLRFETGRVLQVDSLLQHEDSMTFENLVADCIENGESIGTLKQKGVEKYFKVKAFCLKEGKSGIAFHFEDISQSRILENELYEHLIDLYSQIESQEREIADLKAILFRSREA